MKAIKITANAYTALSNLEYRQHELSEQYNACRSAGVRYPDFVKRIDDYKGDEYSALLKFSSARENLDKATAEYESLPEVIALTNAIKEVEGRASARTITAADIINSLKDYTETLGITKKAMEGVEVWIDPNAQKFPKAYKYDPTSTQFQAEYKSGCWRITEITRFHCDTRKVVATMPEATKKAIIERLLLIKA